MFGDVGFERATIRGIAAAAGVDKSSIVQYFGTKQQLFREAVHWTVPVAQLVADTPAQTADNLMEGLLASWARDPDTPMAVLSRASMTSEDAAAILREHVSGHIITALADSLEGPDARLRAGLVSAVLFGTASLRYLVKIPELRDADVADIIRLVSPALESLIATPSSPAATASGKTRTTRKR
jgi:AcrR family transcriptional regulator